MIVNDKIVNTKIQYKLSAAKNSRLMVCFSFHSTDRYCNKTTVINGVTIPKDATIIVPIVLLHHSPLYWKDPEKFDPDRLVTEVVGQGYNY